MPWCRTPRFDDASRCFGIDCHLQRFKECINSWITGPKEFDSSDRVAHGRVIATVIKATDLSSAPSSDVLCEVHRDLPTENGGLSVSLNAARAQLCGDNGVDISE